MDISTLWIPATLAAAAAQTARNAMQHKLTDALGTAGATQVRFLYGLPFALLFLAGVAAVTGAPVPPPSPAFLAWVLGGATAQVVATGLMLAAMRAGSFAVTVAYTKTEPVQVALFGLIALGERPTPPGVLAIVLATAGVVLLSRRPPRAAPAGPARGAALRPALLGIASGAFFAAAAVGFRGGILALAEGSFVMRATTTLAWSLGLQTVLLLAWLSLFDRAALAGSLRVWRRSLFAGFMGAFASQFWFIGFALTAAANVRTLGLVEVVLAAAVSRRLFSETLAAREVAGLALVGVGVAVLLAASAG